MKKTERKREAEMGRDGGGEGEREEKEGEATGKEGQRGVGGPCAPS